MHCVQRTNRGNVLTNQDWRYVKKAGLTDDPTIIGDILNFKISERQRYVSELCKFVPYIEATEA